MAGVTMKEVLIKVEKGVKEKGQEMRYVNEFVRLMDKEIYEGVSLSWN